MFSGIIEELGIITDLEVLDGGIMLSVKSKKIYKNSDIGDSICINGVCLTIFKIVNNEMNFNIVNETLKNTYFSKLKINDKINLESSLKYQEKVSGHLVQGHVESIGKIKNKINVGTEEVRFTIEIDKHLMKYCIYKGSIAIDGISLTIAHINDNSIEVAIVPHTLQNTNLLFKEINEYVNIETDMISKYVENIISSRGKNEVI